MPIGNREKALAGIALAACAVGAAYHTTHRPSVDPCDADPGTFACAVFAQPEWLKRRVYAGRMAAQPAVAAEPAAALQAVADAVSGI